LLISYGHNININNSGTVSLRAPTFLYQNGNCTCCRSGACLVARSRRLRCVSSSAVCSPCGHPARRRWLRRGSARALGWAQHSPCPTWLVLLHVTFADGIAERGIPRGDVAALVAVKTLSWPLLRAVDVCSVSCLSQATALHRGAESPLFSFGFLLCFSFLHLLWPVPSTPSCFPLPLRLPFYHQCSTGALSSLLKQWARLNGPPLSHLSAKSKAFAAKHREA